MRLQQKMFFFSGLYIKGLFLASGLISILTGITEPIELLFMFVMPSLFFIHAIFTGLAMVVANGLDIHLGFQFSAGLMDYIQFGGRWPRALWLIPLGLVFAGGYYGVFRFAILRKGLRVPGSQMKNEATQLKMARELVNAIVEMLGGEENIAYIEVKYTRVEFKVKKADQVNGDVTVLHTMAQFIKINPWTYQIITGNRSKYLRRVFEEVFSEKVI